VDERGKSRWLVTGSLLRLGPGVLLAVGWSAVPPDQQLSRACRSSSVDRMMETFTRR